jgi:predicted MFS family arabinose efflux permease
MQTEPAASFSRLEMSAALLVGSAALLMLGLQPILLGEMVAREVITLEGVGVIAMGEIIALGLGVVLGDAVLPLSRYRHIMVIAALTVAVFNGATCYAMGDAPLAALRAAAGLAEGVLVWITTNIIVRSTKPDRLAAVFIVVQTLSQAAIAALLALLIVPRAGWQGGFVLVAGISLLVSLLARFLPAGLESLRAGGAQGMRWSFATLLPLGVAFLQMAAIGSLWAYLEPLGRAAGFDDQGAQTLISAVLVMQVMGGSLAIYGVQRLGAKATLTAGAILLATIAFAIHQLPPGSILTFSVLLAGFGFTWLFIMPFQIGLAFIADPSGRVAVLIPAMQLLGSAIGPLIASFTVSGDEASLVPLVSSICAVLAFALLLSGHRRLARQAMLEEKA